jgi:hypothetical protein
MIITTQHGWLIIESCFHFCFQESVVDVVKETPKKHAMLSLVSDKETMFNSVVGHVPVICYQVQISIGNHEI